jgi:hypothetical protein
MQIKASCVGFTLHKAHKVLVQRGHVPYKLDGDNLYAFIHSFIQLFIHSLEDVLGINRLEKVKNEKEFKGMCCVEVMRKIEVKKEVVKAEKV